MVVTRTRLHWLTPGTLVSPGALAAQLVELAHGRVDAQTFAGSYRKEGVALLQRWSRLIALMLGSPRSGRRLQAIGGTRRRRAIHHSVALANSGVRVA